MFTVDDLISKVGASNESRRGNDFCDMEIGALEVLDLEGLRTLFPTEKFSETKSVAYLPLKMCHSLPKVNKRGRAFTPPVLMNSVASARDNLVNLDHALKHNGIRGMNDDMVIGHIKTASFNWKPPTKETASTKLNEIASLIVPENPIPMYALGALFMRHQRVPEIIEQHKSGRKWRTSMECGHTWDEACFFYRGEFIPVKDAECAMLECVEKSCVKPYKGHDLAVCLGGLDKSVDFWGLALTRDPADDDVEIMGILSAGKEVASAGGNGKKRYYPLRMEYFPVEEKNVECANSAVDKRFTELASISVIGMTDASEDGHAHEVLSDGTILPAQGHQHNLQNYTLSKGTRPRLTGRTDTHWESYTDSMQMPRSKVHMHTVNIDLRGGKKAEAGTVDSEVSNYSLEDDMSKVQEIEGRLKKLEEGLSTGKSGEQADAGRLALMQELASIRGEMANITKSEEIANAVKTEIDSRITKGELLTKTAHETATAEAVKKIEETHKAELDQQTKLQTRLDEIVKLGVQLEAMPYDDKPELTIKDHFSKIPFDDIGEQLFQAELRSIKTMVELEKSKAGAAAAAAAEKEVLSGQAASAANAGTKKKRVPLLAGAGGGGASEVANDPNKRQVGRNKLLASTGRL